jgi:hypothetical protein
MPHLPIKLFAAALVFALAFGLGQAEAAPLPVLNAASGPAKTDAAQSALPVEQAHYRGYRGYRGWGWGYPRYGYWNNYYYRPYYRPYYYGYGYRPYGYGYWNRPYYRRYW